MTFSMRTLVTPFVLLFCTVLALGLFYLDTGFPQNAWAQSICITDPFAECNNGGSGYGPSSGGPVPLTVALTATPTTVTSGAAVQLSWSSSPQDGGQSCTPVTSSPLSVYNTGGTTQGGIIYYGGTTQGTMTVYPTTTTTYNYGCESGGYTINTSATVTVTSSPAPTVTLTASPSSIASGGSSTLSWSSTNATSCTSSSFTTGGATSGSVQVSPGSTTSYGITCTGAGGSANGSATVTVTSSTNVCNY